MEIKRTVFLADLPRTEQWLADMAAQGHLLQKITGNRYSFHSNAPQAMHYLLLDFQPGAQNGRWVYFEALDNGAKEIGKYQSGATPQYALCIPDSKYRQNTALWDYYYAHRNYFLIHRLVWNMIFSVCIGLFIPFACIIKMVIAGQFSILLSMIAIAGLMPAVFYIYSVRHFLKSCKLLGQQVSWKRPRRPGY